MGKNFEKKAAMPFTITHDVNNNLLFGKFYGIIDVDVLREYVLKMKNFQNPGDVQRIFTDYREAHFDLSTLQLFHLPEKHDKLLKSFGFNVHRIKRAILYDPKDRDLATFFETVAVNRGHMVKVFTNEEDARAWLLG